VSAAIDVAQTWGRPYSLRRLYPCGIAQTAAMNGVRLVHQPRAQMKSLEPIQDRIEVLASKALEDVVEEAEARDGVKVTSVEVQVADTPSGQPRLDLSVTVERQKP
jgi:hypothetical protein